MRPRDESALEADPLWYRDAIIYEAHVRAFYDSDGDGAGDFRGLTQKLEYLHDLGVTAIWLLPFYPSPLKDDGYDTSDYTNVHPEYGTLRDFQAFLREAHRLGIRVITELVLNHTSDQHPWFQRARRSPPGSSKRDFYIWSDTPERYRAARIIFKDFESSNWTWDALAQQYYWHRFYAHQPDLNFDNPETVRALYEVFDFWLGLGVDGLRLDAVPYLFEREGTSCENLPETHGLLRELRRYLDKHYANRMLLAEANQWPDDACAYFGGGDECHMAFHFPVMPRLFMAVQMEDRFPIIDIMQQTPPIPEGCQWAIFLRNHDELTLEMVTDEDRDYMYRVYAEDRRARINLGIRRRLAPLLGNNRRRIELMNGLLFSLPGTPIIYYGDEIGMGDNIYLGDRNSVRTPMQWTADRNAGFSRANPQSLYLPVNIDPEYHYETVNVEAQHNNPSSLLWWMKRLIALRKRYRAFGRGSIDFLYPDNRKVLAFVRRYERETILVVANLSRFVQFVELDMQAFKGSTPVELFGRTEFPKIGELPYFITLGPHAFYWFLLEAPKTAAEAETVGPEARRYPVLAVSRAGDELFQGKSRAALEALLPEYLGARRWFGGKARIVQSARILDVIPITGIAAASANYMFLVKVTYTEGEPETYLLAASIATGDRADWVFNELPHSVIARLHVRGADESAVLYEAIWDRDFSAYLLQAVGRRRRFRGAGGELVATPTPAFRSLRGHAGEELEPSVMRADQSNTSIVYGDRLVLKLFRRPDPGVNPDLEVGRFLTEHAPALNVGKVAGFIEYRRGRAEPSTIAILQGYIANEGDAWNYTLDNLRSYLERVLTEASSVEVQDVPAPTDSLVNLAERAVPEVAGDMIGSFLQSAELLGRRTGELHVALASAPEDPAFSPEPFNPFYQRSVYQSMRATVARVAPLLERRLPMLPEHVAPGARKMLDSQSRMLRRFRAVTESRATGMRIRIHGDYHLGQMLYTGKDFVIIDFEGEPARPLSERRLKRSPLRDAASMIRSFHYAAYSALFDQTALGIINPDRAPAVEAWVRFWYAWVSASFLRSYLAATRPIPLLPQTPEELEVLLEAFILEKAVYEVGYELNNRPEWVQVPLRGVLEILEREL
jgi:maltose alpha-D-glucosyltransferase/alpha-amylase